jgi:hypothetical protein
MTLENFDRGQRKQQTDILHGKKTKFCYKLKKKCNLGEGDAVLTSSSSERNRLCGFYISVLGRKGTQESQQILDV